MPRDDRARRLIVGSCQLAGVSLLFLGAALRNVPLMAVGVVMCWAHLFVS